jgi:hypothetical protein
LLHERAKVVFSCAKELDIRTILSFEKIACRGIMILAALAAEFREISCTR